MSGGGGDDDEGEGGDGCVIVVRLRNSMLGYVRTAVTDECLTHSQVLHLSSLEIGSSISCENRE